MMINYKRESIDCAIEFPANVWPQKFVVTKNYGWDKMGELEGRTPDETE